MIVVVSHKVNLADVLDGFCNEDVYDIVKSLDPVAFDIEVVINRDDEITEVYPGPDGCATALYLGLLPTIESRLKAGEYQEIVQALRIHERKYHNEDLPTEAMRELCGRLEAIEESEAI
jgi:hypothetical protein